MTMRKLVILSPYGTPGTNGLSDHVDQIVAALALGNLPAIERIGVTSRAHEVDLPGGVLLRGDSPALDRVLDRKVTSGCTLVIHYVGYGYQRRACPFSLIRSLRRLRSLRNFRMVSVFHELYASAPPWTSTFYVAPFQRRVFRALVRLSDEVVTSTPAYRRIIEKEGKTAGLHPIISNVGEPAEPSELKQRANRIVVFGLPHSRRRVFESKTLERTIEKLSVGEVLEIGERPAQRLPTIAGVPWRQCGELSGEEVSKIFLQSRFGLLQYPRNLLSKSGVFAAYSSHRMVPVLLAHPESPVEDLRPQVHYLATPEIDSLDSTTLQGIADGCWSWYRNERSLAVCTELYAEWCQN
jgi:hypothetical protein